ncbi:unnamed protein product [Calicophoron daubneyi]|uniref:Uncharacterized protein n=1 Tax=Calicophoron daubneyi TaxID=300641 RepID=A0AAV2SZZ9_CALDB
MQNKDKPEYEGLKREIVKLNAMISSQKEEQIMLKTQIDKLMESLEEEHARCRHESDAKHLMITEINSLRIQCAELEAITRQTQVMSSQTDDPVLLRIALEQAKKAQSEANFEIAKLKADYVDVVPKKEYEQLLAAKQQQEQEHEKQVAQFNEFMQNLAQCEEQLGTVVAQRDEYYRKLQQLTRASTPRPDWNEVGRRLPCGLTKWDEDTHDMTSQQKVFHLLKELTAETEGSEEQEAKGLELKVPRFLRHNSMVFRRSLAIRDCLLLTREIWAARMKEREAFKIRTPDTGKKAKTQQIPKTTFDEFLETFFTRAFGLTQMRIEWAYGYYEAQERYKDYFDLAEIRKVIDNQMNEACHWHLHSWLGKIKEHVLKFTRRTSSATSNDPSAPKTIDRGDLKSALSALTGVHNEVKLDKLVEAAFSVFGSSLSVDSGQKQSITSISRASTVSLSDSGTGKKQNTNVVSDEKAFIPDVEKLFAVKAGEDYNPFIRELIFLYESIKSSYVEEIMTELQKSADNGAEGMKITGDQLKHAVNSISPPTAITSDTQTKSNRNDALECPASLDIDANIEWIMNAKSEQGVTQSMPFEAVKMRLMGSNIFPPLVHS